MMPHSAGLPYARYDHMPVMTLCPLWLTNLIRDHMLYLTYNNTFNYSLYEFRFRMGIRRNAHSDIMDLQKLIRHFQATS